MQESWSNYWQSGVANCFPTDHATHQLLTALWLQALGSLDGAEHILELGCGNGFLSQLILQQLQRLNVATSHHVHLVDYSTVQLRTERIGNIAVQVYPNTPIGQIPLPAQSQQLIVANYAVEYADPDVACREVAHLLAPDGRFLFNVHAKNSHITAQSNSVVGALSALLADRELQQMIAEVVIEKTAGKSTDAKAMAVLDRLKRLDDLCHGGVNNSGFIDAVLPFLASRTKALSVSDLTALWHNFSHYAQRITQQLQVSMTDSDIQQFVGRLHRYDLETQVRPVVQQGNVVSYFIEGRCRG